VVGGVKNQFIGQNIIFFTVSSIEIVMIRREVSLVLASVGPFWVDKNNERYYFDLIGWRETVFAPHARA
jgi:hypothetical protein